jgi:hypothetical protein
VQDKFASILEFTDFKKECVFCKKPLRIVLTNFVGLRDDGVPVIKSYLKDNKFQFTINHTTASFDIKADVAIDVETNVISFANFTNGELPAIDEYLVKQTFEDYRPHIELYCSNAQCGLIYHLSSDWLRSTRSTTGTWNIIPFHLLLEGARVKSYIIHNYHNHSTTTIYSLRNTESGPLEVPRIDFSTMDKERLINRVQTLVIFS